MKVQIMLLAVAAIAFCALANSAQTTDVREIRIESIWNGLGPSKRQELVIARTKDGYKANGEEIDRSLVDRFIAAVLEPEIKSPTLENLGVTQEWLNQNAEPPLSHYMYFELKRATPKQQQLYYETFRNIKAVEPIITSMLNGRWTDDYPSLKVEITESDGSKTVIGSDEQAMFMLPFEIVRQGAILKTYNANISRAIAALMPKKFESRDRLSGESLREGLTAAVHRSIKPRWQYLDVENRSGSVVSDLEKNYKIQEAEINALHAVDYGKEWINGNSSETNARFVLGAADVAPNFSIRLVLPFEAGKVEGLDVFTRRIKSYQELVFSVEWLKSEFGQDKIPIWLRFVRGRSFSHKAMQHFAADMKMLGRSDLIPDVEKYQEDIALISVGRGLEYDQSFWLVLPDRRVILWRYNYQPGLKWERGSFESKTCTSYHSGRVQCAGVVISPDGVVMSPRSPGGSPRHE